MWRFFASAESHRVEVIKFMNLLTKIQTNGMLEVAPPDVFADPTSDTEDPSLWLWRSICFAYWGLQVYFEVMSWCLTPEQHLYGAAADEAAGLKMEKFIVGAGYSHS